jgi:Mg2+ and Co2+ transporter CorA
MKKFLPAIFVVAVLLTPMYPVYAQGTTASPARNAKTSTSSAKPVMEKIEKAGQKMENTILKMENKMASREAELKNKLLKFKNKAKATRVENINSNLSEVNAKATDRMQDSLDRMASLVAKLKTWIAEQESTGKDMSSAKNDLMDLESQWEAASSSVSAQAQNDYTVAVTTETAAKTDVKIVRDQLHSDLKTVNTQLVSIKQGISGLLSSWRGQSNGQ